MRTGFEPLDQLLVRLHRRKAELLKVLERPDIPLHTNASKNDLRACVIKQKISGGTMSTKGRQARDVLLGLMKTCRKLGVSFFTGLSDRLGLNTGTKRLHRWPIRSPRSRKFGSLPIALVTSTSTRGQIRGKWFVSVQLPVSMHVSAATGFCMLQ